MGVFSPLFLGGLALLVLPWFIHRIRRPEREHITFGSLMFVPNIQHEVIERRRVQHLLLMLLRMALLLLLALSFMRPFFDVLSEAQTNKEGVTYHAIVIDASLSMATSNYWTEAKKQAHAIVNDLKPGDQVGVIACGISGDVLAPLSENKQTARQAIDAAQVRWEKMNFATALQSAEHLLSVETKGDVQRVVHLISDFQASGLPEGDANWQLPAGMVLDARMVGAEDVANVSIDALTVRVVNDSLLQIRARIKTWSGKGEVKVQLTANGQVKDTRDLTIPAGNASQAVFVLPRTAQEITGSVEILSPDALSQDNKRFFVHQAHPPHQVVVWPSPNSKTIRSFDRLISAAVPPNSPLPWRVETTRELTLSHSPAMVITADVTPDMEARLKPYVMQGGKLFLPLKDGVQTNSLNALLSGSGVQIGQAGFAKTQSSIFEPIAWVDLNHPIFAPFKGALFNDFSSVRYHNYYATTADSPAVVPARFENGKPAIIDVPVGLGRVVIWTGGMELTWSNLARSPRFVPLIHETLRYLSGTQIHAPIYTVGDKVPNNLAQTDRTIASGAVPGIYRWANGQLAAVNVDADESNPVRVSPAELDIRLSQAPVLYRGHAQMSESGDHVQREEFGYWGIVGIFILLLIEQGFSVWLRTHHSTEAAL